MTDLDFLVRNYAPDEDLCNIKILAGKERLHIAVWRDGDEVVHICIEDDQKNRRYIILGKEEERKVRL